MNRSQSATTIAVLLQHGAFLTQNAATARRLFDVHGYGARHDDGRIRLAPIEALYLSGQRAIRVLDNRGKAVAIHKLRRIAARGINDFGVAYAMYKDLRDLGYVVKTGFKFGAAFRVYPKGTQRHARWLAFPVHERHALRWQDFSAKARVAHSTQKRLLIGVVDDEGDVSYFEADWLKP